MSARVSSGKDSKQDYGTPWPFIHAVEARWGSLDIDLAAHAGNAKAAAYITPDEDSLAARWPTHLRCWLNPPFSKIAPWASKCAVLSSQMPAGGRIFLLVPASVGSEWFAEHVHGRAFVLALRPRIAFDGMAVNPETGKVDGFNKDLMLCVYGMTPSFDVWRWKPSRRQS